MRNQPAHVLQDRATPVRARGVGEQLALNRRAVATAHEATYGAMNAAVWSRRGLLQRLHRRPLLREVA